MTASAATHRRRPSRGARPAAHRRRDGRRLVPPPQFAEATFDTYRADPAYPSQQEAKDLLQAFSGVAAAPSRAGCSAAPKRARAQAGRLPRRRVRRRQDASARGRSTTRCPPAGSTSDRSSSTRRWSGALGYQNTVELFRGSDLLCIDEFELDDPGDTMVMTRLLGELVSSGTRLAATSNTPPNALGEGRFAAQDFLREIHAMAASFQTIRIDGTDYRHRAVDGHAAVLDHAAVRGGDRGCRGPRPRLGRHVRRARRPPRARAPVAVHPAHRGSRRSWVCAT